MQVDSTSYYNNFLQEGNQFLTKGAWKEALKRFKKALTQKETPEALEGIGNASWWLDDSKTAFAVRARAYKLYRQKGDRRGAARIATWLAWDYNAIRGELAVANGWIGRASRLLKGLALSPEHGWLAIREGATVLLSNSDTTTALKLAREAQKIGHSLKLIDLEIVGLSLRGLSLVSQGKVASGMKLLDEASAAVTGGETTDLLAISLSSCYLMFSCNRIRDFDRATQWCNRIKEFCKRYRIRPLFSLCRTQYADVLVWKGNWIEAENELKFAKEEMTIIRPGWLDETIVRLAELRRKQGRFDEAIKLFDEAKANPLSLVGLAQLNLDKDNPTVALNLVDRYLRHVPADNLTGRVAGLEIKIKVHLALGNLDEAKKTGKVLESITKKVSTFPLVGLNCYLQGLCLLAEKDYEKARISLEDAIYFYTRSGTPFEAAQARLNLAKSLFALSQLDTAEKEARAASEYFKNIGANFLSQQAALLLQDIVSKRSTSGNTKVRIGGLTKREVEVLRFIAEGLSNKEIATYLHLSQHTIHRHVANILTKLDLPSRAAAATFAARHQLL
ncbi:hypothetical protein A3A75_00710 [Candidatus Woesebacteria bacterium RIFCSPLOWO2_01_FULL_39_10]|uniref:HTH luxR-type domain-containing protein n=1 Tax=Candidatus Woesebacteria bacterium RIFCSPLOWO2_01_FULL_39_10 TaxID=1802516 RepID=A0A1F8B441_9BACT|nr:MAG: hypothetical protein A3A75_00710 [Candidatus Woesebacteria bacterium RIFCSPLOWO2_01_FULL_39_10]